MKFATPSVQTKVAGVLGHISVYLAVISSMITSVYRTAITYLGKSSVIIGKFKNGSDLILFCFINYYIGFMRLVTKLALRVIRNAMVVVTDLVPNTVQNAAIFSMVSIAYLNVQWINTVLVNPDPVYVCLVMRIVLEVVVARTTQLGPMGVDLVIKLFSMLTLQWYVFAFY